MEGSSVFMLEQNLLPFEFKIFEAKNYQETCEAIKTMIVRGAGAIGSTAGFAMAQAFLEAQSKNTWIYVNQARKDIESTRPTARNLFYATQKVFHAGQRFHKDFPAAVNAAINEALRLADKDADDSRRIGEFGNSLIKDGFNIETHCNAGWLAFTDYGTALSPIYSAQHAGKKVFVYVDETRPRSQGARLTAWELRNENVSHVIIPDNAGAHLMSLGKVDMMIVGADRIAVNGDTANKIGTLEKAIIAKEFNVPFYVAAPTSTFDADCLSGADIPIEERSEDEVLFQTGTDSYNNLTKILVASPGSKALNPAFDVTPAKYIKGIITEKGIIDPNEMAIRDLLNSTDFL